MSRKDYPGPAGIFSTGDPTADADQIACEQFVDPEGEVDTRDRDLIGDELPPEFPDLEELLEIPDATLWAAHMETSDHICTRHVRKDDPSDVQEAMDEILAEHQRNHPGCQYKIEFEIN